MKEKNYNSIGMYDKTGNLVSYAEFSDVDLKCYYEVNGNCLNRKFTNNYEDVSEMVSSVIEYNDNIMLYPIVTGGETNMLSIPSGTSFTSFSSPGISNRVDTYLDNSTSNVDLQHYSVTSNLIDDWLNKL